MPYAKAQNYEETKTRMGIYQVIGRHTTTQPIKPIWLNIYNFSYFCYNLIC